VNEQDAVQWGTTRIAYVVRRSARRATVALTVEGDGRLVVTAPAGVGVEKLRDVVRRKAAWAAQRMKRAGELPPAPGERELVDGETVLYRGRQLRLKVVETAVEAAPRMRAGWYEVPVPAGLGEAARRAEVRRRLVASLRGHAERHLGRRLAELCRARGIERPVMVVREQRRRWGSCDAKGTLRINWRIIQAPDALIDYVLAHELVHLSHPRHGAEFWASLGRLMPDYERRRSKLREMGKRFAW
jgi:hypothetical protein